MSKQISQIKAYAKRANLPLIPIQARDVVILNEPDQFYNNIISNITSSKHRLALSALYLGTGLKEQHIVQSIFDTLKSNSRLDVILALDSNRAKRIDLEGLSSVSLLNRILDFPGVKLNLVETCNGRSIINRLFRGFQKWNEISSTYHAKFLVSDTNLIVTGANLSSIYFEKRRDRYMIFRNSRMLTDYMFQLSDRLNINQPIVETIKSLNNEFIKSLASEYDSEESDSYVIPLTQLGSSGLTDKEQALKFLDSIIPESANVYMASGYFNPSPVVNAMKIDSILAPSEAANGFFGGSGLLSHVPRLYTSLHEQYLDSHQNSQLFLFSRPDWSFHAKGLWIEGLNDYYIHMIGSSNFNYRSSERDFEVQLLIVTRNKGLITKLKDERTSLWNGAKLVEKEEIKGLTWGYIIFSKLLKSFL